MKKLNDREILNKVRDILADEECCAEAMIAEIGEVVGDGDTDGGDAVAEAERKLDDIVTSAVLHRLTDNGYRVDADGDNGEIYIHDDTAKVSFVLAAIKKLDHYEEE